MQLELRKDLRKNPVRQLKAFLDLAGLRMIEVNRRKIGGVATSEYGLDPDRWDRMCELVGADPETGRVAEKIIGLDVDE